MTQIHIVTDSSARFTNAHFTQHYPVTVVPNKINIGGKLYREGVDISPEDALQLIARQPKAPTVIPPTPSEYAEVYFKLAQRNDAIISIHASREIFESWANAKRAAQQVAGQCQIVVVDSQSLCAAQGILTHVAAKAIEDESASLDDIVRAVRGAVDRLYVMYYVETVDVLMQSAVMSPSHSVLGMMLGIKPFVTIEEGHMVIVEKVKTRAQAIENLVEFVTEFTHVEEAVILQHKPYLSEQTRMLQDRLSTEFPRKTFPYAVYNPSFAALIGANATGIVILEEEMDDLYDDFE